MIRDAVAQVPAEWLADEPGFDDVQHLREAYVAQIEARLAARPAWLPALAAAARAGLGQLTPADRAGRPAARPAWLPGGDAS